MLDCSTGVRIVGSEETTTTECGKWNLQLDHINFNYLIKMIVVVDCSRVLSTLYYSLESTSGIRMYLDKRNDKDIKHCASVYNL